MSFIELFLTAIALSMDAFAVSVTTGITLRKPTPWQAIKPGLFFGGFQALMPFIGYIAGRSVAVYIEAFDHWIAFGLLALLGGKMLWDAWHDEEDDEPADPDAHGHAVFNGSRHVDRRAGGWHIVCSFVGKHRSGNHADWLHHLSYLHCGRMAGQSSGRNCSSAARP